MATRYGASSFSRTARSAFNSFRNTSSASQTSRTPRRTRNLFENGSPSMNRRRLAETMIPLHNAAACAKLVTHLSVSSRSCRALASGFSHLLNYTLGIKQVVMATKDEGSIWSVIAKGKGICCENCWVEATSPNPFPSLTEKIIPAIEIRQKSVQKSVQLCRSSCCWRIAKSRNPGVQSASGSCCCGINWMVLMSIHSLHCEVVVQE